MRLLVWNMGVAGSSVASHERAWQYLRDEQDFDVALLQETRSPPAWARDVWASFVWKPKYAGKWGCAVLARSLELLEYEPDATFPWLTQLSGSTAIARARSHPKWLVSVHLNARQIFASVLALHSIEGIEIPTRHGGVWETPLIPHELHRLFGSDTFLWGGDLNTDPGMDDIGHFHGGDRRLFKIYEEAGSCDTRVRVHDAYQRTYFKSGMGSYQLDHVFADAATEARVVSWDVDESPATAQEPYSDHAPIIVALEDG